MINSYSNFYESKPFSETLNFLNGKTVNSIKKLSFHEPWYAGSYKDTPGVQITLRDESPLKYVANEYFKIKTNEKSFKINSEDMYDKWLSGDLSGTVYSDWVNSYIRVWNAIGK